MIGPILLAISWLLLRLEKKNLDVLGFNTPRQRVAEFAAGFAIASVTVIIQQLGLSAVAGVPFQLNPDADAGFVLRSLRWNVNSVLYEELVFRGYLLFQAIRWLGPRRGVLLGAAAFGVYHWFSFGVFGNPPMMLFVVLYTGAFGFMLSIAFAKTQSIAAPIGLHLGWNLASYLGFSAGPTGRGLFFPANGVERIKITGFPAFTLDLVLPLLMIGGVSWLLVRRARRTCHRDQETSSPG